MSGNIRDIREISNDHLTKFTWQLAKKFFASQTKDQTEKLEGALDIYSSSQLIKSALRFHNFTSTKTFDYVNPYYSMNEPDNDKLKVWIRGTGLGNFTRDWALQGNIPYLYGDPMLVDGTPHDDGLYTGGVKSIAIRLNRPTSDSENEEHIRIPDATSLQLSSTTGESYFMRFRVFDIAQQGGADRTLFEKIDDSTPNNVATARITDTGRLRFYIKRAGTWYRFQTTTSNITTNTVYDAWFTYANSGNTGHIYINNVDKSLTDPGSDPNLHSDLTDHDISIFRRGEGTSAGHVYGDLYDFRMYKEKIVSSTEVGYFNTNKLSISDIPFGQVPLSNLFSTYNENPEVFGYTLAGYTTTGFTAG